MEALAENNHLSEASPEIERMNALFARQYKASRSEPPPSLDARRAALKKLLRLTIDNEERIADAISRDFGHRAPQETKMLEVLPSSFSIRAAIKHVGKWMRPERRNVHYGYLPASSKLVPQPKGVVGIISPWNYPLILAMDPLCGALAAGNRCMLKISEYVPTFAALMKELLAERFDEEQVAVVTGGPEVGIAFSKLDLDHILFTGATSVGRHVMRAAADKLTPVTLELGGKSPVVLAPDAKIKSVIDSICFGKLANAGQTCVAPDYALIPESRIDEFVEAMRSQVSRLYPRLEDNEEYTSVSSDRHYKRLQGLLSDAEGKGARVVRIDPANEDEDPARRKLRPTLVLDTNDDMKIMQDEIFGPLMPVVGYKNFDEVIKYINDRPRPLAAYIYSNRAETIRQFEQRTVSGGMCINSCLIHVGIDGMPFGGVGDSGMGSYHGYEGFLTFSHSKHVFQQFQPAGVKLLYPPYTDFGKRLRKFLRGR
jgi:coniferyl-aldehyde dehydrogenase